ncbi:MAG: polysaccharide biosynthesis tyrosine autokinase [Kiritimatiellia bacterium]
MDQTSSQPNAVHFWDYWQIVRSRKEIVLAIFLFIIVVGTVATYYLPKTFMAYTRIAVNREATAVEGMKSQGGVQGYDPFFLRTEFEIIQSKPIIYEVIRNLRLQEHFGRLYNEDGLPMSPARAYEIVYDSMKVHQYRDTNLIEIQIQRSTQRSTPQEAKDDAARIANEIAAVYRDRRIKSARTEKESGLAALKTQFQEKQLKVQELEDKMEALRKELNINVTAGGPENVGQVDKARIAQLEADRLGAQNRMLDRQTRLEALNKMEGEQLLYAAASLLGDPMLNTLREQLVENQLQLGQLQGALGTRHPDVIRIGNVVSNLTIKIEETLKGLKVGLQTEFEIAKRGMELIDKNLEQSRASDISAESEKYLPFRKIEHELTAQRQIRDSLEMLVVKEEVDLQLPRRPVEVIEMAEEPDRPIAPKMILNIMLSVILGLGVGVGLAFFMEYLDTSVKTVQEIEDLIGAPILGVIPQKVRPLNVEKGDISHAEAYRVLKTNLQFSKKWGQGKVLCVTSGGAGEGKSLSLFNLAYVFSQLGSRVLLIDADIRRPTQHKMVGLSNRVGLTDVLLGRMNPAEVIVPTSWENFSFMPSGRSVVGMHGMVDSPRVRALLDAVKKDYDYVLLDAPPILGVSDAAVLCSESDGTLLVIEHRSYPKEVAVRARSMIQNVGGNLVGVVLNNINIHRDYYHYYHYVGGYAYKAEPSESKADSPRGS